MINDEDDELSEDFDEEKLIEDEDKLEEEVEDLQDLYANHSNTIRSDDLVTQYMIEISKIPLLSPDEELVLAKKVRDGDLVAKKKFIESNLRLVVSIAKRYVFSTVPFLDLIGFGNMGLMKAVDKFNLDMGYKFSTYATHWIKQSIQRGITDSARMIRVPVHMYESIVKLNMTKKELRNELGRDATVSEIRERLNISLTRYNDLEKYSQDAISYDQAVSPDEGHDSFLLDFISSSDITEEVPAMDNTIATKDIHDRLHNLIGGILTPRELKVIELRFGLTGEPPKTLEEVGKYFKLTRERIRQVEAKALRKLRYSPRKQELVEAKELKKTYPPLNRSI